ncbi:MAG TPA: TetR/AcrR family transcriptional regulator [Candidatus Limnocylindria bacterium]|nr:TetR/AcrR family transcriptional regulator [Candidatus Limnocylindria bacterium]
MALREARSTEHRVPLNRERVLRAAVDFADRQGIDALSMRRLGQELGVEAMALYNHVANKEDLLNGMVDAVVGEIDETEPDGKEWKAAVRERILAARRVMRSHPWAAGVIASRTEASPVVMRYMDTMGGIMLAGGFSVDLMHHAFHALGSRVLGFTQELFDDSNNELVGDPEMQALMIRQMEREFPNITAVMKQVVHDEASIVGSGCDDQFEFEFAIDVILDGLEAIRQREATAASGPSAL